VVLVLMTLHVLFMAIPWAYNGISFISYFDVELVVSIIIQKPQLTL